MKLLPFRHILCTLYKHAPRHFMQSHTRKVHAYLAVTCHLHFWQNYQDLVCATVVTWGGMESRPWSRKFSSCSCRDLNPQPFNHKSGNFTIELSPLWVGNGNSSISEHQTWVWVLAETARDFSSLRSTFSNPFRCCVTPIASKRPQSFCQNCMWQVQTKQTYTLHIWLWIKWHCKLMHGCMVYTESAPRQQQFHMALAMSTTKQCCNHFGGCSKYTV